MKIYKYITVTLILILSCFCGYECLHSTSIDSYLFFVISLCCALIVALDDIKNTKKKSKKNNA